VNRIDFHGLKHWLGVFCIVAAVTGCSMNRLPNSAVLDKISIEQSKQSKQSPREALALAEKDIDTAKKEALEYYAPLHLSQAEQCLKKAQSLLVKGDDPVSTVAETIKVRKLVAEGLSVKQTVVRQMSDVFEQKNRLDQLKADVFMRDDYNDQIDNIKELILLIEKGEQESFEKTKREALGEMLALEVKVVKKKTLTEATLVLQDAKKIDAKKIAPKTWKIAEDTLKQSTAFIEAYPRNAEGVAKAGLDALRACQHALYVTKETQALRDTDKEKFEDVILDMENKLERIALGLNHTDVRYMPLHNQSVELANAAELMRRNAGGLVSKDLPLPESKKAASEKVEKDVKKELVAPSEAVELKDDTAAEEAPPEEAVPETVKEPAASASQEKVNTEAAPDAEPESMVKKPDGPDSGESEDRGTDIDSIKSDLENIEKKL
jgi:hypothetical protein